ncbi:Lsr2 family DNA-binding protein [Mycolicibacterium mucogenicum]|nr:histone-like nucleoid-structuring protein Lsr2 [Mycolicibacterium mucogenicum]
MSGCHFPCVFAVKVFTAWARSNGHEVGSRGRISIEVRKAFEAAH